MAGGFLHMPALLAKNHAADGLTVRKENNDRIRRRNHASPQLWFQGFKTFLCKLAVHYLGKKITLKEMELEMVLSWIELDLYRYR
jgi:hypothetical protein